MAARTDLDRIGGPVRQDEPNMVHLLEAWRDVRRGPVVAALAPRPYRTDDGGWVFAAIIMDSARPTMPSPLTVRHSNAIGVRYVVNGEESWGFAWGEHPSIDEAAAAARQGLGTTLQQSAKQLGGFL